MINLGGQPLLAFKKIIEGLLVLGSLAAVTRNYGSPKKLSLREELQNKYETRIEKIYYAENEQRERACEALEKRLR